MCVRELSQNIARYFKIPIILIPNYNNTAFVIKSNSISAVNICVVHSTLSRASMLEGFGF